MYNNGISIIIPIYNAEKYIKQCLESLVEIRDEDEIILINDGSTDKSECICKNYQKYNIRLFNQSNSGVSVARNSGIQKASKNWIMFVDADDYLIKGWRKIIDNAIKNNKDADVIVFAHDLKEKKCVPKECIESALGYEKDLGKSLGLPFSKLYKTDLIKRKNITFSSELINGEDMIFNSYIYANSQNIVSIKKSIYVYYKNMSSATNKFNSNIINTEHVFHVELKKILKKFHLFTKEEQKNIYEESLLNGLYAVAYRVGICKGLKSKHYLEELLHEKEYKNALLNFDKYRAKMDKKKKIALICMLKGNVNIGIVYVKSIYIIKKILYKCKKEGINLSI